MKDGKFLAVTYHDGSSNLIDLEKSVDGALVNRFDAVYTDLWVHHKWNFAFARRKDNESGVMISLATGENCVPEELSSKSVISLKNDAHAVLVSTDRRSRDYKILGFIPFKTGKFVPLSEKDIFETIDNEGKYAICTKSG